VVVVENERLIVDADRAVVVMAKLKAADVPWRNPTAGIFEDVDSFKAFGPVIEVELIAELPILEAVIAPFKATLVPPPESPEPIGSPSKRHKLDVVDPASGRPLLPFLGVIVGDEQDRIVAQLVEYRRWVCEKHHVCIEIGDSFELRILLEGVQTDRRRGCPAILELCASRLHLAESFVMLLELGEADNDEVGQRKLMEDAPAFVVHTEDTQAKVLAYLFE
jgi:hypothetical protein